MARRRSSPYSQIAEMRESRGELIGLILGTVLLSVVLNILAALLYDAWTHAEPWSTRGSLLLVIGCALVLVFVFLIVWTLYGRLQSATAKIDLAIPYCGDRQRIEVPTSSAHLPSYRPITLARQRFSDACDEANSATNPVCADWQTARFTNTPLQNFMAPWHKSLVNCLIIDALHRYGDRSLGGKARFERQHAELPATRIGMADLGTLLRDNVFVQAVARAHPQWGMSLPAGVLLKVEENDEGITWTLHHRWQGAVVLRCFREYRTSPYRHKVGRILGAGLSPNQQEQLRVLTSRIEATASSRWILIPAVDAFHEWATGLIAFLEEELDWGYFEHGLTDRIVTDLMWMIGDLPEGVSIWDKLTSIETRLSQPERAISAGQDLVG